MEEENVRIIGWRAFLYDGALNPVSWRDCQFQTLGITWDPNGPPGINDRFGFWSFKTRNQIENYVFPGGPDFRFRVIQYVFATVLLHGEIVEHTRGYRAHGIEIMGLYSLANNSTRRGIARTLGFPKVQPFYSGKIEYQNS